MNNITQKKYYRGIVDLNHDYATVDYDYSSLDRLTAVDYSDSVNEDGDYPQGDEAYLYDLVGNRLADAKTGANSWDYNQNNELQGFDTTRFKYNLNGQMTEKTVAGVKTYYSYNLDGRLSKIKDNSNQIIAQYEYDPFGRRTKKYLLQTNETVYFHYSNEGLVGEYDKTGQLVQSYGYKPDSYFTTDPVFTHRPDFTDAKGYAYYINDHLGTPQKLITNTGRKIWEASEDAFGKTIIVNNEFRNPLRFPGQYTDEESFLRYNYFRYYDPTLGRYITSDPIGLKGGLNTYAYVGGRPTRLVDPDGLKARVCCRKIPWLPAAHCFIEEDHGDVDPDFCGPLCKTKKRTLGLQGSPPFGDSSNGGGEKFEDHGFDDPEQSKCGSWKTDCHLSKCLDREFAAYANPSNYSGPFGPNSNTFAYTLALRCGLTAPSGGWPKPGWGQDPAKPFKPAKPMDPFLDQDL